MFIKMVPADKICRNIVVGCCLLIFFTDYDVHIAAKIVLFVLNLVHALTHFYGNVPMQVITCGFLWTLATRVDREFDNRLIGYELMLTLAFQLMRFFYVLLKEVSLRIMPENDHIIDAIYKCSVDDHCVNSDILTSINNTAKVFPIFTLFKSCSQYADVYKWISLYMKFDKIVNIRDFLKKNNYANPVTLFCKYSSKMDNERFEIILKFLAGGHSKPDMKQAFEILLNENRADHLRITAKAMPLPWKTSSDQELKIMRQLVQIQSN